MASPLTRIVQAPQTPCSQPTCVPVSARSSLMKSTSSLRGGQRPSRATPLTVSLTVAVSFLSMAGLGERALDRARGEHAGQMPAVVGGGVNVGVGLHQLRGPAPRRFDRRLPEPVALEDLLGLAQSDG